NNKISSEIDRELHNMTSNYSHYALFPRSNQTPNSNHGLESQLTGSIVYNTTNPEEFFYQTDMNFDKDVEDEADIYFQKLYNQDQPDCININQFFELLRKLHDSNVPRDNSLFLCMLRNLLKEYRYLNQYPERELIITGEL